MTRYAYAAWEASTQAISLESDEILAALTDDLLQSGDLTAALNELLRRGHTTADGAKSLTGLEELLRHLQQQKQAMLRRYAPDTFQASAAQVEQWQQQVTALPVPEVAHARLQQVQAQFAARQRHGTPRPPGAPWEVTEVVRHIQRTLAPRRERPEPRATLEALHAYLGYIERLEQRWQQYAFSGTHPVGTAEAERLLRTLQALDLLEQRLRWGSETLQDLPGDIFDVMLDPSQQQQFQHLQQLEARLHDAGLITRTETGLRLTVKGTRQVGLHALRTVLPLLRRGMHGVQRRRRQGQPGPLTGETHDYVFGEPFDVHLGRTLSQTVQRQPGVPLQVAPEDFAVYDREMVTHSAMVIMLDMSHSMELFGRQRFTAAKKVALALAALMRTTFPRDMLHIIGFGDTARVIALHDLPYVTVQREHTNTQEGLRLARRFLRQQRAAQKQIMLITDGRPTAVTLDGRLHLHTWGLHPTILDETYKEAKRCREQAIVLNTFMVADDAPLLQFVQTLTAVSQGRAFYTTPERLGQYVIADYMRGR